MSDSSRLPKGWAKRPLRSHSAALFVTCRQFQLPVIAELGCLGWVPIPSQGPVTVAAIDAVVQDFMTKENVFGAALAITSGTRLVYAKGYTNAPAGYPAVTPQTLFRQASVSKVFTGVAMWKLINSNTKLANGKMLSIDTPIQSILNLKQPNGQPTPAGAKSRSSISSRVTPASTRASPT